MPACAKMFFRRGALTHVDSISERSGSNNTAMESSRFIMRYPERQGITPLTRLLRFGTCTALAFGSCENCVLANRLGIELFAARRSNIYDRLTGNPRDSIR